MQRLISVDFRITSTWHAIMDQVEIWRVNQYIKQENQDPNAPQEQRKHLKGSALRKTIDHFSETFITTRVIFIVYITDNHECCNADQNFI